MLKFTTALALGLATVAAPAAAIEVISTVGSGNTTTVGSSVDQISVDVALNDFSPVTVTFGIEDEDTLGPISFDSVVDVFTGVNLGLNLASLTFTLSNGVTFASLGTLDSGFAFGETASLDMSGSVLTVSLLGGEPSFVSLGDVGNGGTDFFLALNGLDDSDDFTLTIAGAAVPEASTWAMMIAGFGIVGFALRRRGAVVAA